MSYFQHEVRRGSHAQLVAFGPLQAGEMAFETDTKRLFIGDGAANYAIGGGSTTCNLADLWDVTISGIADDEFLQYDSASGKWLNQTYAEALLLYPVTVTAVADDEFIQYDTASGLWINQTYIEAKLLYPVAQTAVGDKEVLQYDTGTSTWINRTIDEAGIVAKGIVLLDVATELTIATGVVTATQTLHTVDTEGDAASDDLDTITAGANGQMVVIRANNAARTVVVKDGTGNLEMPDGDASLDDTDQALIFFYYTDTSKWVLAGGSGGSGGGTGGTAAAFAATGEIPGVEVDEYSWIQYQMDAARDFSAPTVDAEGKTAQTYWYYNNGTAWTAYPAIGVPAGMSEQQNDHGDYETQPVTGDYAGYAWMYEVPAAVLTVGTLYYRRFRQWDGTEYGDWQMLEPIIAQ